MNETLTDYTSESLQAETAGYVPILRRNDPARHQLHEARVAQCVEMWADLHNGRLNPAFMREAGNPSPEIFRFLNSKYPQIFYEEMTTSDFDALNADVLDRKLLANFEAAKTVYQNYCRVSTLTDFRTVSRRRIDGGQDQARVQAESQGVRFSSAKDETDVTYSPQKFVNTDSWSWEAALNDDLGIFNDLPQRLANGHVAAIERQVTALFVDSSGPHATPYATANLNQINTTNGAASTNPVLSVTGLGDALTVLGKQINSDGEPIVFTGQLTLVVPNALRVAANNIMNQLSMDMTSVGGASNQTMRVNNWIIGGFKVVVNPWIDKIATTNGNTSWWVFTDPSMNRPALEIGFLRGFQTPQLFQKASNTMRAGGGIEQAMGDFNNMSTMLKALTVFGSTRLEPKASVASDGSGS